MHRNYTRPLFALLALIIASLACTTNIAQTVVKGRVTCSVDKMPDKVLDYVALEYTCDCPYGNIKNYKRAELDQKSTEQLEAELCFSDFQFPSIPQATATPTLVPTATSTPTKRPTATPAPYLSGDVTTCNLTDRYINFPIDPNAADISGLDFEVTIGGVPSTCNVPSSNAGILSCTFPQGQTFPAQVIVNVDGFITNNFSFDGGICVTNSIQQDNSGESAPPVEPSPTTDPLTSG